MAESKPSDRPPWWGRHWLMLAALGLSLIVLLAYSVLAVTVLPWWIVSMNAGPKADDNTRLNAIANTRGALLGVLAPIVVAIGAVAAFLNYRETSAQNRRTVELNRETLDVTRRGQLTERFTKAIEQLGDNNLDIRLGGIYALEQIAKESPELHAPVMVILTAFLREHSRKPQETSAKLAENEASAPTQSDSVPSEQAMPLRADFQAIATVLGGRQVSHDRDFTPDLRGVSLSRVNFVHAQLQEANFLGAQLREAHFEGAQLEYARFEGAQLQRAYFSAANLRSANFAEAELWKADFAAAWPEEAWFHGAQLQEANFLGAQLQKVYFLDANLRNASFAGANLRNASFAGAELWKANFENADLDGAKFRDGETDENDALGLTPEQFDLARNVDKAILPNYVAGALKWKLYGPSE